MTFDSVKGQFTCAEVRKEEERDYVSRITNLILALHTAELLKVYAPELAEKALQTVPAEFRDTSAEAVRKVYLMAVNWNKRPQEGGPASGSSDELACTDFRRGETISAWDTTHVQCFFQSYRDKEALSRPAAAASASGYNGKTAKLASNACTWFNSNRGCRNGEQCDMVHKCAKCGKAGHNKMSCKAK
eukprot:CAMPEP_0198231286 /NCGR_PEP_ID=MMETSP1445-20131203/115123_1 /TAXON_ID=36898 /ORGANISM="Pyramimonas sp., Strain CCMP2087" /LENGTH=187 /DNA_ID=CAMNT_0043911893 /DNA_START=422 /DNA_END=984 /DNA_ORIENTATION=+